MPPSDFDQVVEQYHETLISLLGGDPEPTKRLWSRREDVLLLNPLGVLARGWSAVMKTADSVATHLRDGAIRFDNLSKYETPELAFIVEIERASAKIDGGGAQSDWDLRATTIFRREDGEWRIMHRHADSPRSALTFESLARK